jgi:hypothetical protein
MKTGLVAIAGMLSVACGLTAREIDSRTIHNYDYFSIGYGYLHDVDDSGVNGHGAVGEFSFEEHNFLIAVTGGYFWPDDTGSADVKLWNVSPGVGYVLRLAENHVNIIPRVAVDYSGIDINDPVFGNERDESWFFLPGVFLSYAINNRFAINGGYTYSYKFDNWDRDHLFSAGAAVAIVDPVDLAVTASFSKDFGFTGIVGALKFHY